MHALLQVKRPWIFTTIRIKFKTKLTRHGIYAIVQGVAKSIIDGSGYFAIIPVLTTRVCNGLPDPYGRFIIDGTKGTNRNVAYL